MIQFDMRYRQRQTRQPVQAVFNSREIVDEWEGSLAELTVSSGANIAYHDSGSGMPILFLHSFGHNRNLWFPQLTHFQERGFRVIAPDMPGHGESSFDAANHTVDRIGQNYIELLDHIGIHKAVIAGISIGGYVALRMHARRPDLFAALVMCCSKAEADSDAIRDRRRRQIESIRTQGLASFIETGAPKRVSAKTAEERPWVVDWIKMMNYTVSAEANAATLEAMASKEDDTRVLGTIQVPALILSGSDDVFIPEESPQNLAKGIRNSVHHVIRNAGHVASLERPFEVNQHVENFLASV